MELEPCPLCGSKVHGYVCGGADEFGFEEYQFEVNCLCGLSFESDTYNTEKEAERKGVEAWNARHNRRTCEFCGGEAQKIYHHGEYAWSDEFSFDQKTKVNLFVCVNCGKVTIEQKRVSKE